MPRWMHRFETFGSELKSIWLDVRSNQLDFEGTSARTPLYPQSVGRFFFLRPQWISKHNEHADD